MKTRSLTCLILISALLVVSLTHCGKDSGEKIRIALVIKATSNPFFARMQQGATKAADSLNVELLVASLTPANEIEKQILMVEDMTNRDVRAILISPADSKEIVDVLKKARDNGIFVINLDNRIDPDAAAAVELEINCYVGVDNEEGGHMAGKHLVELMAGKGKVAMLEGTPGQGNAEARKRGFLKAIADTEIQLVASRTANWAQNQGYDVFTDILQNHPDISGVFCANDMMAMGAIQALEKAGRAGEIFVTAYDNLWAARESILQNQLHATIDQHPELMGFEGVLLAAKLDQGQSITREKLVPLQLITRSEIIDEIK